MAHSHPSVKELAQAHRKEQIAEATSWRLAQAASKANNESSPEEQRPRPARLIRQILSLVRVK